MKFRKITALLLVLCMLLSLSISVFAAEADEHTIYDSAPDEEPVVSSEAATSGTIQNSGIRWSLDEKGWLTISGSGEAPVFQSADDQPWAAVRDQITEVWFEDVETLTISDLAYWFEGCTSLTTAELPLAPVIGRHAFYGCSKLSTITMYYGEIVLKSIGEDAFWRETDSGDTLYIAYIIGYPESTVPFYTYDWAASNRSSRYFYDLYGVYPNADTANAAVNTASVSGIQKAPGISLTASTGIVGNCPSCGKYSLQGTYVSQTHKVSSEMVTAIMASLAQKGSEAISGNVQWGYQKRMRDGTFIPPFLPYGYKTVDKKIYIDEQQAEIVRQIFMSYLSGQSMDAISEQLNASRIPLHTNGADRPWRRWIISYILSNEKYTGDSLWQKTYTTATFPTIQKKNNGERMQYYVENTHPAIISKDIFNAAQKLMRERSKRNASDLKLDTPFRQRMVCGNCGSPFRLRRDRDRTYWSCKLHSESSEKCSISQIDEQEIMATFCRLYYKLKHDGNPIFTQMLSNLQKNRYSRMLWSEDVISLNKKISDILSQVQFLTQLQQVGGVDPDTFITSNNKLSEQLRRLKQEKARLLDTDSDDLADRTRDLMDALEDGSDFLDSFDALVEKIIVDSNERLRFRLKNGLELLEQIERTRR